MYEVAKWLVEVASSVLNGLIEAVRVFNLARRLSVCYWVVSKAIRAISLTLQYLSESLGCSRTLATPWFDRLWRLLIKPQIIRLTQAYLIGVCKQEWIPL